MLLKFAYSRPPTKAEKTDSKYSLLVWKPTTKQFQRVAYSYSVIFLRSRMVVMVGAGAVATRATRCVAPTNVAMWQGGLARGGFGWENRGYGQTG